MSKTQSDAQSKRAADTARANKAEQRRKADKAASKARKKAARERNKARRNALAHFQGRKVSGSAIPADIRRDLGL